MKALLIFIVGSILSLPIHASLQSNTSSKLIFAIDVIRHGDRTPIKRLPNDPLAWENGLGELTPLGMHQEYRYIGVNLRKHYVNDAHLLPEHYEHGTILVRSSDYDRTLMSAQSVMLGLYPLGTGPVISTRQKALPSFFQPIPIHTTPKQHDTFFLINQVHPKAFHALLAKYVYTLKAWQRKNHANAANFKRWSQISGLHITGLPHLWELADNLNVRLKHGLQLPKGMSEKEAKQIVTLHAWVVATWTKSKPVASWISHQMLQKILINLHAASIHRLNALRYVLYSGHDTDISALMAALGNPLDRNPQYSANVRFELYERNKTHFVKTTYREPDNTRVLHVPGCPKQALCPLSVYLRALQSA